jgi:GntR family transcriptional regulator
VIEFHLDARSGVAPYQQVVQQVRHALRLGLLEVGDQLPTVKEVVTSLAINPNTVLKAYKELEHLGLVAARPGIGIFVTKTLSDDSLAAHGPLRQSLQRWLSQARRAGLDEESIEALFRDVIRSSFSEGERDRRLEGERPRQALRT